MGGRQYKIDAARAALEFVESGMRLGIGTGSTAEEFVRLLGERVAQGLDIIGVPTSERTARLCAELSIPLTALDETPELDLTIDGADEVTPDLALIKGGGGALLREKIVAAASKGMVVVADDTKAVQQLGAFPLPIEVNRFGLRSTIAAIEKVVGELALSAKLSQRMADGKPFETDGGHLIIDASFGRIPDPRALSAVLNGIPGVVEHGIFLDLATHAIFAGAQGVRTVTRPS